jgi:hypothetical protein
MRYLGFPFVKGKNNVFEQALMVIAFGLIFAALRVCWCDLGLLYKLVPERNALTNLILNVSSDLFVLCDHQCFE